MKNLFDSHCHLNEDGINVKETIENAKERGIDAFLVVGWDIKSSKKAVELANEFDEVHAAVGIHPENYETENEESLRELETLAKSKKVVAIGEIGLDYHWKNDEQTKKEQKEWFIKQIKLANKLNLPVSIHARDAINDVYQTIKENPEVAAAPTGIIALGGLAGYIWTKRKKTSVEAESLQNDDNKEDFDD